MTTPVTPVAGYQPPSDLILAAVNANKEIEERILRDIETCFISDELDCDIRWLSVAKTHIQEAYMAWNRALLKPQRVKLPEDDWDTATEILEGSHPEKKH